jgi:prophage regulatory protein
MQKFIAVYSVCEQILRLPAVMVITGKCRSSIYDDIKAGRFPRQKKLGRGRSVGWSAREIQDFVRVTLAGGEYSAV